MALFESVGAIANVLIVVLLIWYFSFDFVMNIRVILFNYFFDYFRFDNHTG